MESEKKMETYKEEVTKEIETLKAQVQSQKLKIDDMKLRLEMFGIYSPTDATKVCISIISLHTQSSLDF